MLATAFKNAAPRFPEKVAVYLPKGARAAVERARGRAVTIKVDGMTFIRPVRVGDVLSVYTQVESIGRTSMKIHIEAWAKRFLSHEREKVTDATFTFVAIDENGRPRPIPRDE